jgi:Tfp pilus assembly protein PilX
MRLLKNNQGIALVAIIMMMMILLTISTAGLLLSAVNLKTTSNYKTGTAAFNVADAGINNGWMALGSVFDTLDGSVTLLSDVNFTYGGSTGTYTVQALELAGTPKQVMITSTGCFPAATFPCSSVSKAVIEARFKGGTYAFNNAIESAGETNINDDTDVTGGSLVDSFDSRNGNYNTCLNPPSCTQLNKGAEGDIRSNQDITLSGSNTVVSGNATSHGTINATGGATITGTPTPDAPQKDYAPVSPCGPPWSTLTGITNVGSGSLTLDADGNVSIQAHADVHFAAGTYCFKSVTVSGNSTLTVDGAVKLYLTDYSDLSGGTISNYSCSSVCDAEQFQIFSSVNSESQGVKVAGGSATAMTIYAPQGRVQITGGSDFLGAVVGVKVDVTGGTKFHYDKKLKNPNGSPLQLISWRQVF